MKSATEGLRQIAQRYRPYYSTSVRIQTVHDLWTWCLFMRDSMFEAMNTFGSRASAVPSEAYNVDLNRFLQLWNVDQRSDLTLQDALDALAVDIGELRWTMDDPNGAGTLVADLL